MRTGHCLLDQYLHRFNRVNTPPCNARHEADEKVQHYLLHCGTYERQRRGLAKVVDLQSEALSKLLVRRTRPDND
ncbi:hypothetical protein J132_08713 [Termitomyces sp. J132]|nr:hypothetical protein J132_08713 [Termitomyces sp. J132]